jgi:hypothetical protein
LAAARDQLHRLTMRRVPGDRAVVVPVEPHDFGEHVSVAGVALRL